MVAWLQIIWRPEDPTPVNETEIVSADRMKLLNLIALTCLTVMVSALSADTKAATEEAVLTPKEATQIAKEAYVYGFPLVLNYKTMYEYAVDKNSAEYKADFNTLACDARVFTPEDRAIVTPNSDTPYCMTWVDLRAEPVVFTIPEIEKERFYEVQIIDLYTHNVIYDHVP